MISQILGAVMLIYLVMILERFQYDLKQLVVHLIVVDVISLR